MDIRQKIKNFVKAVITILTILLFASNAWWIYQSLDRGVSLTYANVSLEDSTQAFDQTLSIVPLIAGGQNSKDEIITHLQNNLGLQDGFEKDGVFWIGRIGLRFDDGNQLIDIQPAWN